MRAVSPESTGKRAAGAAGQLDAGAVALVDGAPFAMARLVARGTALHFDVVNAAFERLVGQAPLQGCAFAAALPDFWRLNPTLKERLGAAPLPPEGLVLEALRIYLAQPGQARPTEIFVDLSVQPQYDAAGALGALLIFATEVKGQLSARRAAHRAATDLRTMEHAVQTQRVAEQQVVDVLEGMRDAFFAVDRNWTILRINAHQEKLGQIPRDDQLGKSFIELFLPTAEHKKSRYWREYSRVMKERVSVSFEEYYPNLRLWTSVDAYPTRDGGMAVFYRDVTAQKTASQQVEAEKQKFEAIFFDSPASMALLRGADLVYEKVNRRYLTIMGQRDLLGKSFLEAVPELEGQPFFDLLRRVFTTGEPFVGQEMLAQLICQPGGRPEPRYFDFTYSRVDDGAGAPYGVYIHAIDVTDKVVARRRVEKLADDLKRAVSARDDFLSIASHELKTPITSLKLQLEMTRRKVDPARHLAPPPEKLARVLDMSTQQIARLSLLIDDLLDISRLQTGKLTYRFESIDLAALLQDVVERFTEQLAAAHCPLEVSLQPGVTVRGDRFRLEQVVTNLLSNAIKYGDASRIRVASWRYARGGAFSIADGGMGIAPKMQQKIFKRFERAISHHHISGLGLGLFITEQIVVAHGGRILLQSELGSGSCFTVELPA